MQPLGTPTCFGEVRVGWRLCPVCEARLDGPNVETETVRQTTAPSPADIDEGRFPAGTMLAGRYRVHGHLGKGGIGEVYRAFDLILNQTVALKFLTKHRVDEVVRAILL